MKEKNVLNVVAAVGLLAGGIIGAGVFALPYVMHQSGLAAGFSYLLFAAVGYCLLHLMYAEIVMKTPGEHRFVGYVERYLGKRMRGLAVLMAVIQMIFVLTIYLILSKSFITLLLPALNESVQILLFWALGSLAIFMNLRRLALSETLITLGMVLIILVLFVAGIQNGIVLQPKDSAFTLNLLPLPAILFALSGRVAIPSVVKYLSIRHQHPKKKIKTAVIWGTVISAVVYGLFVLGVLGLSPEPSPDTVSALVGAVSPGVVQLIGLLGFFALWSSYILVGLDVDLTLKNDLKFDIGLRLALVVALPLLLYFFGLNSFIGLISVVGGVFLVGEAFLIVAMRKPSLAKSVFLIVLFSLSLIGVILNR